MEKKDILLKEYLCDNGHFCDFINGVLFEGNQVLLPDAVEEVPTELIFTKKYQKRIYRKREKHR